jgi:general secretion pathway protein H
MKAGLRHDGDAGFTMVEILVVLAILAVAATLAWPQTQSARTVDLEVAADTLSARLTEARTRAIARAASVNVDFDPTARRYIIGDDKRVVQLPPDLALTLTMARSELSAAGLARLTFMPDGSATGGTIRLARGPRRIDILVSWLTGGVELKRYP